jgi:hypothetical protein
MRSGIEIVTINDIGDVENALLSMWPENRIPVAEFHSMLTLADVNLLKFHAGVDRTYYSIREIADLIWERSNYERNVEPT